MTPAPRDDDAPACDFAAVFFRENKEILRARRRHRIPKREGLVGLALSGGGIRSATFSLGVLQALARHDKLASIDYLSTVSGGGYIGAWLSAWIHRKGLAEVQAQLKPRAAGPGESACEAPEITWLRRYSNYLAPRLGLLSADSMTLVATWVRNVLLNLVILVALLGACCLLARLLLGFAMPLIDNHGDESGYAAAWVAFFLFPTAVSFNLSGIGQRGPRHELAWTSTTPGVLLLVVLPGLAATVLASIALFSPASSVRRDLANLALGVAVLLALGGVFWLAYQLMCRRGVRVIAKETLIFALAYAAALGTGYALLEFFMRAMHPLGPTATERAAQLLAFGPPGLMAAAGIAGSVVVGLVGRVYFEASREWLGRLNAWFVTVAMAWLAVFGLAFYAAPLLAWADAMSATWVKALAGAGWVGGLATALLVPKPGTRTLLGRLGGRAIDAVATLVVAVVCIAVAGLTTEALVRIEGSPRATVDTPQRQAQVAVSIAAGTRTAESRFSVAEPAEPPLAEFIKASFVEQGRVVDDIVPLARQCRAPRGWRAQQYDAANPWEAPWWCVFRGVLPRDLDLTFAVFLAVLLVLAVFGWRVDVNKFSLHNLYKNRLIRCYLGASRQAERRAQPFTGFDDDDDVPLARLRTTPGNGAVRPLHIINTALNITHGSNLAWQERKAASFTFSPFHCGYALGASTGDADPTRTTLRRPPPAGTGGGVVPPARHAAATVDAYRDARRYGLERDAHRQFTLGMAMATSGAAVSPHMGRASAPALAFVLTLFNVRLGRWSPNPQGRKWTRASPALGLVCLLQELFGYSNERRNFVYLSDGGHFDNTGVYELVRRGCMTIVAVDAGADYGRAFDDLANLVRKCRVDFGVRIELGFDKLGTSRADEAASNGWAVGQVHYGPGRVGRLIVIKPTLLALAKLGVDVFSYAKRDELFPQQSTVDQFFDETQFESYRALGERIGSACLEDRECRLPAAE